MHGTLRDMARKRQAIEPTNDAEAGDKPDSIRERAGSLLADAYRARLGRLSRTEEMAVMAVLRIREAWGKAIQRRELPEGVSRATAELDVALEAFQEAARRHRLIDWNDPATIVERIAAISEALSTASEAVARAITATNPEATRGGPLDGGRGQLGRVLLLLRDGTEWLTLLLNDFAEGRSSLNALTPAEKMRRMRRRRKLGYAGTVAFPYHQRELRTLARMGFLPDPAKATPADIQTAFRSFLLAAFNFLDWPENTVDEAKRSREEFRAALERYQSSAGWIAEKTGISE
jgi:hypothetical protein